MPCPHSTYTHADSYAVTHCTTTHLSGIRFYGHTLCQFHVTRGNSPGAVTSLALGITLCEINSRATLLDAGG